MNSIVSWRDLKICNLYKNIDIKKIKKKCHTLE